MRNLPNEKKPSTAESSLDRPAGPAPDGLGRRVEVGGHVQVFLIGQLGQGDLEFRAELLGQGQV